jgi:hypothetical protein
VGFLTRAAITDLSVGLYVASTFVVGDAADGVGEDVARVAAVTFGIFAFYNQE